MRDCVTVCMGMRPLSTVCWITRKLNIVEDVKRDGGGIIKGNSESKRAKGQGPLSKLHRLLVFVLVARHQAKKYEYVYYLKHD